MSADLLLRYLDDQRDLDALRAGIGVLIHERRLDIATQPIFDLRGGNCIGVEALARFPSGWGSPDATFRAADAAGLGVELERLAVQQAWPILEQLRPRQFLTVNLSPVAAVALAERATAYAELPLNQLVVEITEHKAIDSYAPLRAQLRPLRKLGLRVAVDDAGAGYASLRHVVELRPDFIKVDRDLVHGIADDHARRVAVRPDGPGRDVRVDLLTKFDPADQVDYLTPVINRLVFRDVPYLFLPVRSYAEDRGRALGRARRPRWRAHRGTRPRGPSVAARGGSHTAPRRPDPPALPRQGAVRPCAQGLPHLGRLSP